MTQAISPTWYRIAIFAIPEDRSELAEILAKTLSLLPTDAAIQARNLPGLVNGEFPLDAARRATQALAELGLHAEAIPVDQTPHLHPCETPHHLRWPAEGLEICGLSGEVESTVAWPNVEMISVGQVPLESTMHHTDRKTTFVSAGRHHVPEGDSTARLAAGPEAWVVCREPHRVLRLDHKRFNYEGLAERKTESATANFRQFLMELVARAQDAYLTPATMAFLTAEHAQKYSFASVTELERSTLLHLLIRRSGRSAVMPSPNPTASTVPTSA
ncbi:MAG: hypothetical protein EHM42_00005 [Planctomycetaceae bacterium]|nr:MAG: hypothetical protein EHM42_00005 [Planctomycetaceae bacterium]